MEIHKQLIAEIDTMMPTMKRHLGSDAARVLREKLTSLSERPDIMQQFEDNLGLAKAILSSWTGVVLVSLSEEEKNKLRGKDAIKEWNKEIVEEEIRLKKSHFLLEDLNLEDEDQDEEDVDVTDERPKIKHQDLTIEDCRKLSKLYVSEEVTENIKAMEEALDEECGGLEVLNADSTTVIISFWEQCISQADASFEETDWAEGFITLLALTVNMFKVDHWISENQDVDGIVDLMSQLGAIWKKCLEKSFQELGVEGDKQDLKKWLLKNSSTVRVINPHVPEFNFQLE